MDGYKIQVVDDVNEDGTENVCFKNATYLELLKSLSIALLAFNFL